MSEAAREVITVVFLALICVGFGYWLRGTDINVGLAETISVAARNQERAERERQATIVEANELIAAADKRTADLQAQLDEAAQE